MLSDTSRFEVDFWPAAPELAGLVSGYHRYALTLPPNARHPDVFFPAWANLRVKLSGDPWRVRVGSGPWQTVDGALLFGPTSMATFSDSGTGVVVGAGLTPLGWRRLTAHPAEDFADRIVPLDQVMTIDAAGLTDGLGHEHPKTVLDRVLRRQLRPARDGDDRIVAIHAHLAECASGSVAAAARDFGLTARRFNQISRQSFGFGPKLLLRRARFLQSLVALSEPGHAAWSARISPHYHDHSHFIRDAQEFLGMSPGQFLRMARPLNAASMRRRTEVLGAPAQALARPRAAA